jgi:hypothetical protein
MYALMYTNTHDTLVNTHNCTCIYTRSYTHTHDGCFSRLRVHRYMKKWIKVNDGVCECMWCACVFVTQCAEYILRMVCENKQIYIYVIRMRHSLLPLSLALGSYVCVRVSVYIISRQTHCHLMYIHILTHHINVHSFFSSSSSSSSLLSGS